MSGYGTRIATAVERRLRDLGTWAFRRPIAALAVVGLLSAAALATASRLQVNADLSELLPRTFPSLQAFDVLKERFGGIGFVVVVGQGAEPETLRRFAADVAKQVDGLETVRYVDYLRPMEFFRDHALYFLDLDDLTEIQATLEKRLEWEKRHANPMYVDFEDALPPSLEFTDIVHKYAGRGDRRWVKAQLGEHFYLDEGKRLVAVFVKPAQASTDLSFTRRLVGEVKDAVGRLDLAQYPGLEVGFTGTYPKRIDQQEIIDRDLRVASLVAFLLIFGYFLIHFRQITAVAVALTPMLVGTLWTYGFAGAAFGVLNILTSFIGAIIMGIGNDHGLHLLARYKAEVALGRSEPEAARLTFGNTGRAALVSALTSCVGFAGLGLSEFRAFREFGLIAAAGGLLMVLAYMLTLPALLSLAMKTGWRLRLLADERATPLAGILTRRATGILVTAAFTVVVGLLLISRVGFNYDFNSLGNTDLESFRLDTKVNALLGYSQTPVVMLTDSLTEESHAATALRASQRTRGRDSTVDFIVAGADLVPQDQAAKEPHLRAIGDLLRQVSPRRLSAERRGQLATILRMTEAKPFGRTELPVEVRRQFQGLNSLAGRGFVLAFPAISTSDGHAVMRMASEIRAVTSLKGEVYPAAGESLILADILHMVINEAPIVLTLTVIATFLISLLLIGRLRETLLALGPTAATLIVTLGFLPLMWLPLNYLNIILIPFLFGYGIESGAHLVTRLSVEPDLDRVLPTTGRAIVASLSTTAFGFGAMLIAKHPGLRSLSELALVGLGANMLACTVVLPSFVVWYRRRSLNQ
ncbi:MAG: MMPL family transporter [Deltaproteobacteria bacterium]|nr:MMPL family transporter [Deltaproteobacteria bacterium]